MNISDIFNIDSGNSKSISLVTLLMLFYVLITLGDTADIISKQTKELIHSNRYIQHVLGFMTLFILITLIVDDIDTRVAVAYALLGYLFFIFTTKLDAHWNIIILVLLFIGYGIEHSFKYRLKEVDNDKTISNGTKNEIHDEIRHYKNWIVGTVLIITIIGTLFYSNKKAEQYGGGYDTLVYIFGKN
jgi:hypothetical protein